MLSTAATTADLLLAVAKTKISSLDPDGKPLDQSLSKLPSCTFAYELCSCTGDLHIFCASLLREASIIYETDTFVFIYGEHYRLPRT